MADTMVVRVATLGQFVEDVDETQGVDLRQLAPLTTLVIRTMNSEYRVTITQGPEVSIQGGAYFPEPTLAWLDGASIGGNCLKVGWIGVGLLMEICSGGRRIVTSPVCAIAIE